MTLELPHKCLIVEIPDCNVAITAAAKAYFRVWAYGKSIASRSTRRHLSLDSGSWSCQVPDGDGAGFSAYYQGPSIWQKFDGPDVVVPLKAVQLRNRGFALGQADVPNFDTPLAASVYIFGWVTHGDSTNHIPMWQCVNFSGMSWDARAHKRISRDWHWSGLPFRVDMEGICPVNTK